MYNLNISANISVRTFLLDIISLLLSYILSFKIVSSITYLGSLQQYLWIIIVFVPTWLFIMAMSGMYDRTTFYYADRVLKNLFWASLISTISIYLVKYSLKEPFFSNMFFLLFLWLNLIIVTTERVIYRLLLSKLSSNSGNVSRVIIVGTPSIAEKFSYYIKKTQIPKRILGYVQIEGDDLSYTCEMLGELKDLNEIIKQNCVDHIVFALPKAYVGDVEKYILMCEEMGVTVSMLLDLYDLKFSKTYLSSIGTLPMLTFHTVSLNRIQLFLKRVLDIVGAVTGIILTSIIWVFAIIAIKLESPGPAIFVQDRVGLNGRIFKLYKFRSMLIDAEDRKKDLMDQNEVTSEFMFKMENDPRVTKVGKIIRGMSIDELPQFINILKGDMGLVGTRPPTIEEVSIYENHHRRRISIKPGITGLWQVSGRSSITDFDEVVKLDTKYIDEWSIWKDLSIIFKTFIVIFKRIGAY